MAARLMPRWWDMTQRTLSPPRPEVREGVKSTASQRPKRPVKPLSQSLRRFRTAARGSTARARKLEYGETTMSAPMPRRSARDWQPWAL